MAVTDLPPLLRSEVEVAADATWALIAARVIPRTGVKVATICSTVGISPEDLRLAALRAERMPDSRLKPKRAPIATYYHHPSGREDKVMREYVEGPKLTDAGRKGAAEAVFASWRAQPSVTCSACGEEIAPGAEIVIEAARHAHPCTEVAT